MAGGDYTSQVFAYGGPPAPQPWVIPDISNPWWPGPEPKPWRLDPLPPPIPQAVVTLHTCERCSRHIRIGEPCPFCMRDDIAALEKRLDEALNKEAIAAMDAAASRPKRKKRKKKQ